MPRTRYITISGSNIAFGYPENELCENLNADTVDYFHASQTPQANTVVVSDSNGFINDWINQGSGSNLDADKLDGHDSSYFATSDHNHDDTYVKLSDYTDQIILNKIKNVDGTGSELDADLLDGKHASYFADSNLSNVDNIIILNKVKSVAGPNSGLDADLLDGHDSSYFAIATHDHDNMYLKLTDYVYEESVIERFTLTSADISNKYITLSYEPNEPQKVLFFVDGNPIQSYGTDYQMDSTYPTRLTWDGLDLDGILREGDKVTVIYYHTKTS